MSRFAEPMARLIDELKKLPGVGSKSAQRLAFHILRSSEDDADALAGAIHDVKASLRLCSVCNNITDIDPCTYCASATRNRLICVVEEPKHCRS
jgi:recombination protein RecR